MEINGSSAVVTGGASGLGEAVARRLVERGAKVVLIDLQEDKGNALAAELGGLFVKADVSSPEQVGPAMDAAAEMGPLRALVNCAGIGFAERTINREGVPANLDAFTRVIRINLIGTFNCIAQAASRMNSNEPLADNEKGAIVNISSVAAFDGQIGQAAYSASKGGVVGLTLPVARDLSAAGIRVNTIAPGLIDTPIYGQGEAADQFKSHLGKSVLFPNRLGTSDEIATMV
ncbi:MAG: SDR family NAD(P)-dependent oxidoreductase, partial [Acidimicrobiia bacterium]|nr:SDR family NAD(P)-dependent oxidoreductase [Acidimicrobiia bacterium]